MKALTELEQSVQQLLSKYQQLQADYEDLHQRNLDLRQELIDSHAELKSLRERNRTLMIARALSETDESREKAKQQLTRIIGQVDRALEVLKQ